MVNLLYARLCFSIATVRVVTPSDPEQRGCCLAVRFSCSGDEVCKRMLERGIAVSVFVFMCVFWVHARMDVIMCLGECVCIMCECNVV